MDCDQNIISLGNNKWLFETNPVLLSDPVTPFRATFQGIYHQVMAIEMTNLVGYRSWGPIDHSTTMNYHNNNYF